MASLAHVCDRRVPPLMPSIPRLILKHLERFQDMWHERCMPSECRQGSCITCICIERLGRRMGDAQALQLAQALSVAPSIACLKTLQLCHNAIGPIGLKALFTSLERPAHLQHLALCHNPIGNFPLLNHNTLSTVSTRRCRLH